MIGKHSPHNNTVTTTLFCQQVFQGVCFQRFLARNANVHPPSRAGNVTHPRWQPVSSQQGSNVDTTAQTDDNVCNDRQSAWVQSQNVSWNLYLFLTLSTFIPIFKFCILWIYYFSTFLKQFLFWILVKNHWIIFCWYPNFLPILNISCLFPLRFSSVLQWESGQ